MPARTQEERNVRRGELHLKIEGATAIRAMLARVASTWYRRACESQPFGPFPEVVPPSNENAHARLAPPRPFLGLGRVMASADDAREPGASCYEHKLVGWPALLVAEVD